MNSAKIFYTSIAGINFRCTPEDMGSIIGYVKEDPENQYNPKAVGVYRLNGSLLGYVADKDLDQFYEFKGDEEGYDKMVFSGNIKKVVRYDKNFYVGNIAIIKSQDEDELTELMNQNFFEDFDVYGKTEIVEK